LKLPAPDGKLRETDCANTEGLFRIIQSIPSKKAEPFKLWLAKTGYDPSALVRMLQVMQSKWKADGPGFMKTHPSPADRIKAVEKVAKEVPAPSAASTAARSERETRYKAALGRI